MSKLAKILVILAVLLVGVGCSESQPTPNTKYVIRVETSGWPVREQCYWTDNYAVTRSNILVVFAPYWMGCSEVGGPIGDKPIISESGLISDEPYLTLYLASSDRVFVGLGQEESDE